MMDPKTYEENKQNALESGRYLAVKQFASGCSEVIQKALDARFAFSDTGDIEVKVTMTFDELQQWNKFLTAMKGLCK